MSIFLTKAEQAFGVLFIVSTILCVNIESIEIYWFLAITTTIVYGWYKEAMRMHIWVSYVMAIITFLTKMLFGEWTAVWLMVLIVRLLGIWLIVQYGRYYYMQPTGPYGIGHKSVKLNGQTWPAVSIFYPIDRDEYEAGLDDKTLPFILEGRNGLIGIAYSFKIPNENLFKGVLNYRLRAIDEANLHKDFADKHRELTPVIISHGDMMNRTSYASIACYLASYGCIVYALDHTDASWTFFKNIKQDPPQDIFFEEYYFEDHKISYEKFIEAQMAQRILDINCVLEMIKNEIKSTKLFDSLSINLNKLVVLGHSFGADTALECCSCFLDNFKLCIALDSTFFWKWKIIKDSNTFMIKQPLLMLNTERYHSRSKVDFFKEYRPSELNDKLFNDCKQFSKSEKSYNLTVLGTDHVNQSDMCLYYHNFYKISDAIPQKVDVVKKYEETIHAICAFLDEHDFLPVKFGKKVNEVILDR